MGKIKNRILKHIPPFWLFLKQAIPVYYRDMQRFYKFSAVAGYKNEENKLIGKIIERYHSIEKGLTMPELRLGFGKEQLLHLIKDCKNYLDNFGTNDEQVQHAISVVFEYKILHMSRNFQLDDDVLLSIEKLIKKSTVAVTPSEQKTISRTTYFKTTNGDFFDFSNSRRSLRNYSKQEVNSDDILKAISLSQNAPSACNRQTSKVYLYSDKKKIDMLLQVQGGNRGFGHLANKLIVITADLGVFGFISERNQAYVDGGIFAMNLLYSLHYYQIGACILNCATSTNNENKIREISADIKESEVIIAMIACGIPPENFHIASSKRLPFKNVCNYESTEVNIYKVQEQYE